MLIAVNCFTFLDIACLNVIRPLVSFYLSCDALSGLERSQLHFLLVLCFRLSLPVWSLSVKQVIRWF